MTVESNIELLKSFKEFNKGWNGVDSEIIPHEFIEIALSHISKFAIQPKITPYDNGICFDFVLSNNSLMEINISDNIEFITWNDDNLCSDQVIESKFISSYANRVLKQQLKND